MAVTLEEMKNYLRVDYDEDDALIESIIGASERLCMDVARMDSMEEFSAVENARIAVLYAAAYLYEHREELTTAPSRSPCGLCSSGPGRRRSDGCGGNERADHVPEK